MARRLWRGSGKGAHLRAIQERAVALGISELGTLANGVEPGDIPVERPAALSRLDALVGTWEMEASFEAGFFGPGSPAFTARSGRTTFHWLEGQFFLIQRATVEDPSAPSGIMIIGVGETPEIFEQHYYDSRGVARVYQMSLNEGL